MLVIFLFVAVFCKLLSVTVINGESMQVKALSQWYRDLPIQAERGEIVDINGVVLADSQTTYTVYARPIDCVDKTKTARILSEKLNLNYERLVEKLQSKTSEITIKKGVDKETILNVHNLS